MSTVLNKRVDSAKPGNPGKLPSEGWLILAGILVAWTPIHLCWPIWFSAGSPLGVQALIPAIVGWLIWNKRVEWKRTAHELSELFPDARDPRRRGNLFFVVLGGLGAALSLFGSYSFGSILSLYVLVVGSIYYLFGPFLLRVIASPLLLLLFMIPPPSSVIHGMTEKARLISASMTGGGLELIGIQNRVLGNEITIAQTGWRYIISPSLSGLSTFFTVMLFTFAYLIGIKSTLVKSAISISLTLLITSIVILSKLVMIGRISHTNISTAGLLSNIPALPAVLLILAISFILTRPLFRNPGSESRL